MSQLVSAITQLNGHLRSFPCRVLAYRESVPTGLCGSYVSLSGAGTEHIVGLLSHPLGWESLSRALDHDSPRHEPRGLVEGACELGMIVADAFKRRLSIGASLTIGLPLFADGMVSSGRQIELQAADIALGSNLVLLVLFSQLAQDLAPRCGSLRPAGGEGVTRNPNP